MRDRELEPRSDCSSPRMFLNLVFLIDMVSPDVTFDM